MGAKENPTLRTLPNPFKTGVVSTATTNSRPWRATVQRPPFSCVSTNGLRGWCRGDNTFCENGPPILFCKSWRTSCRISVHNSTLPATTPPRHHTTLPHHITTPPHHLAPHHVTPTSHWSTVMRQNNVEVAAPCPTSHHLPPPTTSHHPSHHTMCSTVMSQNSVDIGARPAGSHSPPKPGCSPRSGRCWASCRRLRTAT